MSNCSTHSSVYDELGLYSKKISGKWCVSRRLQTFSSCSFQLATPLNVLSATPLRIQGAMILSITQFTRQICLLYGNVRAVVSKWCSSQAQVRASLYSINHSSLCPMGPSRISTSINNVSLKMEHSFFKKRVIRCQTKCKQSLSLFLKSILVLQMH